MTWRSPPSKGLPVIEGWWFDRIFGRVVVRGWCAGQLVTRAVDWWAKGKLGTPDGVYKQGDAA